eukprot:357030-Chlamydomonas_euryale.AAC.3
MSSCLSRAATAAGASASTPCQARRHVKDMAPRDGPLEALPGVDRLHSRCIQQHGTMVQEDMNTQPLNRPGPQSWMQKAPIYRPPAEQDRYVPVKTRTKDGQQTPGEYPREGH